MSRGRTTAVGGAVGSVVAVAVADGSVATVAVGAPPAAGSTGAVGAVVAGPELAQDASSAGEIIAALITTERTTSLNGERPW
jgi:hypothetical protein